MATITTVNTERIYMIAIRIKIPVGKELALSQELPSTNRNGPKAPILLVKSHPEKGEGIARMWE